MTTKFCNRRTFLRFGAATLVSIGTAGCLNGQSSATRTDAMRGLAFKLKTATINPGQTVIWKNTSDVDHTVTAYEDEIPDAATYFASGGFDSERAASNHVTEGLIAPGDEYEYTFEEPGTYEYYCIPHDGRDNSRRIVPGPISLDRTVLDLH